MRFVVLHHVGYGAQHFDLMLAIDEDGPLLTWRCPAWPIDDAAACTPLPPHRRAYLAYEGDLSGGRGRVRRVDEGLFDFVRDAAAALTIEIGGRLVDLPKQATDITCI